MYTYENNLVDPNDPIFKMGYQDAASGNFDNPSVKLSELSIEDTQKYLGGVNTARREVAEKKCSQQSQLKDTAEIALMLAGFVSECQREEEEKNVKRLMSTTSGEKRTSKRSVIHQLIVTIWNF